MPASSFVQVLFSASLVWFLNGPNLTMAASSLVQVLFTGFSYGGLSEIPENDFYSCSMAATIAGEIGVYGYRPSVLMDMLAGKRAEVGIKIGAYMRTFAGDCSPTDLETALQVGYTNLLMYKMFIISIGIAYSYLLYVKAEVGVLQPLFCVQLNQIILRVLHLTEEEQF